MICSFNTLFVLLKLQSYFLFYRMNKNNELTFAEKVKLIKERESSNMSERGLASKFKISKSQVHRILQNKAKIISQDNTKTKNVKRIRLNRKLISCDLFYAIGSILYFSLYVAHLKYAAVDRATFTWFCNARSHNIPVSGAILKEKAIIIAKSINQDTTFEASNGWLNKFISRNNITFRALSGESADVDENVVNSWQTNLDNVCAGYKPEDIFNIDETGLNYRQIPKKSYVQKGDTCKGGTNSKIRLTVCLFVNFAGDRENPIVIGNAKKPRSFGRIDVEKTHNIMWRHNKTSWMTSIIFEEVLRLFNRKMKIQNRSVLLVLDNATCHPKIELSNVQLLFLPPNTTSVIQPLDQGIIQCFKLQYRKLQIRHLISGIDANVMNANPEKLPPITLMDAVAWIRNAYDNVKPETIRKCFMKCGFKDAAINMIEFDDSEIATEYDFEGLLSREDAITFANSDENERKLNKFLKLCIYM